MCRFILVMLISIFTNPAFAEIYKDFLPSDNLASIKAKYPNAQFVDVKAGWLKENEGFVRLTGVGISGTINLKFSTIDWLYKSLIKDNQDEIDKNPTGDNTKLEANNKVFNEYLARPLEQKLGLDWLRWVPDQPIPFDRIVSKYGASEKCDFAAEDFRPYCEWTSKGVSANLSDDKKFVYSIEYTFTDSDRGMSNSKSETNNKPETSHSPETKPSNKIKKKPLSS